jgi:hypothetical protein
MQYMKECVSANMKIKYSLSAVLMIFLFISHAIVFGQEYLKIKRNTILTATAGKKLGEIGIEYIDNPTAVGKSINPIYIFQQNRILVGDSLNQRIQEFDLSGRPVREFLLSGKAGKIESIDAFENKIYVLSGPRPVEVSIFSFDGRLIKTINLAHVGALERSSDGVVSFKKERLLNGTINKVLPDRQGNLFVLGSDLVMINENGEVLRRWGPNAFNFIFDRNDELIISYGGAGIEIYGSDRKLRKKFEQYERGKFISSEWKTVTWPEYIDAKGNLYGFAADKDMHLARYDVKDKAVKLFPIKQSDFIGASWTVDSDGNIYYAEAGIDFTITKVIETAH